MVYANHARGRSPFGHRVKPLQRRLSANDQRKNKRASKQNKPKNNDVSKRGRLANKDANRQSERKRRVGAGLKKAATQDLAALSLTRMRSSVSVAVQQ